MQQTAPEQWTEGWTYGWTIGPMNELMDGPMGSLTWNYLGAPHISDENWPSQHGALLLSETATFLMICSSFTNITDNYDSPLLPYLFPSSFRVSFLPHTLPHTHHNYTPVSLPQSLPPLSLPHSMSLPSNSGSALTLSLPPF